MGYIFLEEYKAGDSLSGGQVGLTHYVERKPGPDTIGSPKNLKPIAR